MLVGYDIVPLQAPSATGTMLDILSYIATKSIFAAPIRRILLNDNKIVDVRELGAQITNIPPMFYPMKRVHKEQWPSEAVQAMHESDIEYVLTHGFGEQYNNEGQSRTIQEYAAFYRTPAEDDSHLPSTVLQRTLLQIREWEGQGFKIFSSLKEKDVMAQVILHLLLCMLVIE